MNAIVTRGYLFGASLLVTAGYLSAEVIFADIDVTFSINRIAAMDMAINRTAALTMNINRTITDDLPLTD